MSDSPKVSVIVPIYGVEKYLRQCVGSILAQTLKDIEVILVDDGSSDRCPEMVDEYARRDPRVVAIHQPNSGYGRAVNQGLRVARGEYIGIIEPDDWIDEDMYEDLYNIAIANKVQVVRSNYYRYLQSKGNEKVDLLPAQDIGKVMSPKIHSDIFYCRPTVWAAIYNRQFLKDNDISFLETPGASYQDVSFNFKVLARAARVWLTSRAYVHYRSDNENASTKATNKIFCIVDEWKEIDRYMSRYPEDKEASYALRLHVRLDNYMWNLKRINNSSKEKFRELVAEEYRDLLHSGVIRRDCFTRRKWIMILRRMHPHSFKPIFIWLVQLITGLILKPKIENNKRCLYAFFGLIRIHSKDMRRPSFYDSRA